MTASGVSYYSSNYHKHTYDNRLYQGHLRAFLKQLYAMLAQTEARSVLDAGCGEGFVADFLARQDPDLRITGVDLSEAAVAYAQEHFGAHARFRAGSLYKLPFSDNSFDAVVCSEVLEHLEDPERAIGELKRVARTHVLITVPREPYFGWLNALGRLLGATPDPGHVHFWTKKGFQDLINRHFDAARFARKHGIYQLALASV